MNKKLLGVGAALAAALAVLIFLDGNVFLIRNVQIRSEEMTDSDAFLRSVGIEMGTKLRKLDKERLTRQVERTGEWKCLSIEKKYPSTLVISVQKRTGAMFAELSGNVALMDEEGVVISLTGAVPDGDYLYVTGLGARDGIPGMTPGCDAERLDAAKAFCASLRAQGAVSLVSEMNVEDVLNLYCYSVTGIRVFLGDAENLDAKVAWMAAALTDLFSRGETGGELDVSSGIQADYRSNNRASEAENDGV